MLLVLAVAVGAVLRGYRFDEIGLSHFDEGIYALSGLWPFHAGESVPFEHLYSPWGFPFLIGLSYLIHGGPSDSAILGVSWFFGIATVPLIWWISRSWWGRHAGVVAAWLIAVDGMQIAFSRIGLTDATFNFFMLLSLFLARGALLSGGWGRLIAAGLAVGFTWNIKYNGFLPLLLGIAFIPFDLWRSAVRRLVAITIVAGLCYLPWLLHVQSQPGGYSALVQHHRGYVQGLYAVPANSLRAVRSFATVNIFAGGAVVFVCLICLPARLFKDVSAGDDDREAATGTGKRRLGAFLLGSTAMLIAITDLAPFLWVGLAFYGTLFMHADWRRTGIAILAAMLILPGVYTFYLRLWLPTESLLLLFSAAGIVAAGSQIRSARSPRVWQVASVSALLAAAVVFFDWDMAKPARSFLFRGSATGYRETAVDLANWSHHHGKRIRPFVRPPLRYYLLLNPESVLLAPLSGDGFNPRVLDNTDVLAVDHMLADSPAFRREFRRHEGQSLRLLKTFHVEPSLLTKLDDFAPNELPVKQGPYAVRVYERIR